MTRISSVLLAVVGIIDLDGICAFLDYLFKKLRRGVLGFIGRIASNNSREKSSIATNRYSRLSVVF
jgi:hypothetical protein